MAVETLYRSSRDLERLFMDKAEADAYDKMLELAEHLTAVFHKAVPSLKDEQAEELGIYVARHREVFAKAFGKKPEVLADLLDGKTAEEG